MRLGLFTLVAVFAAACGSSPPASVPVDAGGAPTDAPTDLATSDPPPLSTNGSDAASSSEVGLVDRAPAPVLDASDASDGSDAPSLPAPLPVGYPTGSASHLDSKSINGPLTNTKIGFQVYVPPGYDSGALRYPVVYDLHGLTGSQFEDPQWVVPSLEAAMKKSLIGPVIVVFPDGLMQSYYADSFDGKAPSETRIIRELIPWIDANYRTVANRQLRAVTGFSMGGYGAMEFATKFPDLFRVGVAYDAALDTWQTLVMRRAAIAQATFGNMEAYFDKYSPWAFSTANAAVLTLEVSLRLVPGPTYQMFDASFRDHLQGLVIPLDYVETTCPHDYGCALGAQGAQSWTFIQAAFAR
jgi:S-formylglutathione hydrolase FrmB